MSSSHLPQLPPETAVNSLCAQANTTAQLGTQRSFAPNDRGFCGNFVTNHFQRTQPGWGSTPVTLGGVEMPWTEEMECGITGSADPHGFPIDWRATSGHPAV